MDIQIKKSLLLSAKIRKAWLNMEKEELVSPYLYYNFMKYVWWQTKLFSKYRPIIFSYKEVDKRTNSTKKIYKEIRQEELLMQPVFQARMFRWMPWRYLLMALMA